MVLHRRRARGALATLFLVWLPSGAACTGNAAGEALFDPVPGSGSTAAASGPSSEPPPAAGVTSGGSKGSGGQSNSSGDAGKPNVGGASSVAGSGGSRNDGQGGSGGQQTAGSAGSAGSGEQGGGGAGGDGSAGSGSSCADQPEICDGIDNDCDDEIDPGDTCPAGCSGATFEDHIYLFCRTVDSADAALRQCKDHGLSLVSIESQSENAFVAGQLEGTGWLGASDDDDEGRWIWLNGGAVFWEYAPLPGKYQNFELSQPDNGLGFGQPFGDDENCAVIRHEANGFGDGSWDDVSCDAEGYRAVCESG